MGTEAAIEVVQVNCQWCGQFFFYQVVKWPAARFCSERCARQYLAREEADRKKQLFQDRKAQLPARQ